MAEPLKNQFFQRAFFERLADEIHGVHRAFDRRKFLALVFDPGWEHRALKARLRHGAEALGRTLPDDYRTALGILLKVERHFGGFDHLIFADFVERFGVGDADASLPALEVFTRSTAEFAVRPFIRQDPDRTLAQMLAWTRHGDERVRRLASEGCRPRLPWGDALAALTRDPSPILPILEALKDDPSEAVRRSVANNLGDIAKDHPDLAVEIGERWMAGSAHRAPLVKHALRSLLKKGHRRALHLFGVGKAAGVTVDRFSVTPKRIPLGGAAVLRVTLRSTRRSGQRVRLEYALTYARPGRRTGRKVFKIADADLAGRGVLELERKLSFVDRSIRSHHPGPHAAALIVNGRELATASFALHAAG